MLITFLFAYASKKTALNPARRQLHALTRRRALDTGQVLLLVADLRNHPLAGKLLLGCAFEGVWGRGGIETLSLSQRRGAAHSSA